MPNISADAKSPIPQHVLNLCPFGIDGTAPAPYMAIASSGLSGALVVRAKVGSNDGSSSYCVRCWPLGQSMARVREIHRILQLIARPPIDFIALPLPLANGDTLVEWDGRVWDVSRWLPGDARLAADSGPELWRAAGLAVGQVHAGWRAAESDIKISGSTIGEPSEGAFLLQGHPPSLNSRLYFTRQLYAGGLEQIDSGVQASSHPLRPVALAILSSAQRWLPHGSADLESASQEQYHLQFCFRDLRPDHVLFCESKVTGIVDYDAIRKDSPMCDLARMMEPLSGADSVEWQAVVNGYRVAAPLVDSDERLLGVLHRANPVLSALQWLNWIFVDQRDFAEGLRIQERLQTLAGMVSGG